MPASLARRYDEPVDVEHRDGEPVAFVRRGRRHVVRAVLAHWWETGAWWMRPDLGAGPGDDEHELWRVEAAAGGRSVVVLELSRSQSTARWTVRAVLD
jgi:hypothetical protein